MTKSVMFGSSSERYVTDDHPNFLFFFQIETSTAAFASGCAFSKAHSFQFSDCLCHNQEIFNLKKNLLRREDAWMISSSWFSFFVTQ